MTEDDKFLVRCWSAVVARGLDGTASDVRDELASRGIVRTTDSVAMHLAELRSASRLPRVA